MDNRQLSEYLEFAKQLADQAGEIMRKYFLTGDTEWKSDNNPVTLADTEINSMVIEQIRAAYPDHSVLGEEESANLGQRSTWVCDPVDGTLPYAIGIPASAFSLALCDDGQPVIGVVYEPFFDRLFYAARGLGAYCNDDLLQVNQGSLMSSVISLEDVTSKRNIVKLNTTLRESLYERGARVVTFNSVSLPTALIAAGQFTAVIFNFSKPEDGAAAKVIVEEAGGKFTDIYGNEGQRYNQPIKGYIASNGVVHDELVKLIQKEMQ